MWKGRRKASRESGVLCRSTSKVNFVRSSLKDVENLLANEENDNNVFNETLGQPSPCSTAATAKRLSIFHRVHLANKFARAFSVKQTPSPESNNDVTPEILAKSGFLLSIPPESNNDVTKPTKSDSTIKTPAISPPETNSDVTPSEKSLTETNDDVKADDRRTKSDYTVTIPGSKNRVIIYTTSLRVVRPTFEACRTVQSILRGFRVSIDERDLSMDSTFLHELQNLIPNNNNNNNDSEKTKVTLPRVFIGGKYIGGAEEVKELHESGELKKIVEGLPAVSADVCGGCGDVRFVMCDECRGSHKCYSEKGGFRSCTLCNENGLVRCPDCLGR